MNLPTNHTNCWLHCTLFISSWWVWEHLYVFVSFQFYNQHFHSFLLTSLSHFSKVGIKPLKPDRLSLPTLSSSSRSFSSIFSLSSSFSRSDGQSAESRVASSCLKGPRSIEDPLGRLDPYLALGVGGWVAPDGGRMRLEARIWLLSTIRNLGQPRAWAGWELHMREEGEERRRRRLRLEEHRRSSCT